MLRKCALVLLALAACKGGTTTPAAALPDTCSSDAECAAKFRCDRQQRRCVCTGDDACPGQFCNAFTGQCVASVPGQCTSDAACGAGNYCNRGLRACKPITAFCQACPLRPMPVS
jgi:Cys-rich repeat protein